MDLVDALMCVSVLTRASLGRTVPHGACRVRAHPILYLDLRLSKTTRRI